MPPTTHRLGRRSEPALHAPSCPYSLAGAAATLQLQADTPTPDPCRRPPPPMRTASRCYAAKGARRCTRPLLEYPRSCRCFQWSSGRPDPLPAQTEGADLRLPSSTSPSVGRVNRPAAHTPPSALQRECPSRLGPALPDERPAPSGCQRSR